MKRGMVINNIANFPATLNFGSIRLWDCGVRWCDIEKIKGVFDWSLLDKWVALAQLNKKDILYTFGGVPTWATNIYQDFTPFIIALVNRYKKQISFYELWNEPNLKQFWPSDANNLMIVGRATYAIIKGIDSTAIVIGPAGSGGTAVNDFIKGLYASTTLVPWDVFNYHAYLGDLDQTGINGLLSLLVSIRNVNTKHLPIWFTEGSWGNVLDVTLTPEQKMVFMTMQHMLMADAGIERYYWYAYDSQKGFGNLKGLESTYNMLWRIV